MPQNISKGAEPGKMSTEKGKADVQRVEQPLRKVIGTRAGQSTCRKILQKQSNEPGEVLREMSGC